MYDFEKFKASAFKNKYEIAFETDKKRINYGEVLGKVNALYNALANMGISGRALVFCGDAESTAVISFALSKAGVERILLNKKIPCFDAGKMCKKYLPSVCFLPANEFERLAPTLEKSGVKCVITTGDKPPFFPAQFELSKLIESNDFKVFKDYNSTDKIEFYEDAECETFSFADVLERDAVVLDIPLFCPAGARLFSNCLYSGKKCFLPSEFSPKYFKKHKVKMLVTDSGKEKFYKDFVCEKNFVPVGRRIVDGSFFDSDKLASKLSSLTDAKAEVSFNGAVIGVSVIFDNDADDLKMKEETALIRSAAIDLLYPFDKKKTITVKKLK